MTKEILVNVKQILNEDFFTGEVTYGDQEAFSIAVQQVLVPGPGSIYDPYKMSLACFQNQETGTFYGTNLLTFHTEAPVGTEWQFFTLDGKKLGFRLRKVYYRAERNEANFLIYNEEIAAYMYGVGGAIDHMCLYVPRKYVTSDTQTLDDVVKNAEKIYEQKGNEYLAGFDTNANNILGFVVKRQAGYDGADIFTSCTDSNFNCMRNHCKLHYFSSWYKLITGEFYKKNELFSANIDKLTLTDTEKQTFYFGKILDERPAAIDANAEANMKQYTDHDASISARDLIYGTSLSARWLMPGYSETEGLLFKNGMKIFLYLTNGVAHQKIVFTVKADEGDTTEEYTLHQVMWYAGEMHGPYGIARTSLLQCFLIPEHPGGNPEGKSYGTPYDAGMLFIEPMYNSVPAAKISDFIEGLDEPSDPGLWGQYPLAPIRFYSTYTADTKDDCQIKVYGATYEPKYISFTFTGWCNTNNSNNYMSLDSIYHPNYPDAGCDIPNKHVWAKIMAFEKPPVNPPSGGGGSLGDGSGTHGGEGSYDDNGDEVGIQVGDGYVSNNMLAMWYLGDNFTASDKIGKINQWLNKHEVGTDYSARIGSIVSFKAINFFKTPLLDSPEQEVYAGKEDLGFKATALKQYEKVTDYATFHIAPYYDTYLDMSPYTQIKLFLPYAQSIELDPEKVTGKDCAIDVVIDYFSGDLGYFIRVKEEYGWTVAYRAFGNCGIEYPLTGVDYSGKTAALTGSLIAGAIAAVSVVAAPATAATTVMGAAKTFAPVAGAALGLAATTKMQPKPDVIGTIAGTAGAMDIKYPYLSITRRKRAIVDTENFGSHYGYPSGSIGLLGDYEGYTKCQSVHLENMGYATKAEIEYIERKLLEGVHL